MNDQIHMILHLRAVGARATYFGGRKMRIGGRLYPRKHWLTAIKVENERKAAAKARPTFRDYLDDAVRRVRFKLRRALARKGLLR